MGRPCAVCTSDRQSEIEVALTSGRSFVKIAADFPGIGRMALQRHKREHLQGALVAVRQARTLAGATALVDRLEAMVGRVESLLIGAENRGNVGQALSAVREWRATVELLAKVTGELDTRPVIAVNVLADPTWLRVRGVMLEVLQSFPEARLAVADGLRRLESPRE
jgi:hypothetical protein